MVYKEEKRLCDSPIDYSSVHIYICTYCTLKSRLDSTYVLYWIFKCLTCRGKWHSNLWPGQTRRQKRFHRWSYCCGHLEHSSRPHFLVAMLCQQLFALGSLGHLVVVVGARLCFLRSPCPSRWRRRWQWSWCRQRPPFDQTVESTIIWRRHGLVQHVHHLCHVLHVARAGQVVHGLLPFDRHNSYHRSRIHSQTVKQPSARSGVERIFNWLFIPR